MIRVHPVGHIGTSLGVETIELQENEMGAAEMIERLRKMARGKGDPGFSRFNTIIIVNEGVAFSAASQDKTLEDGDEVVLLPISHGG